MDRTQMTIRYMAECHIDKDFICFIPVKSRYGIEYTAGDNNVTLMAVLTKDCEVRLMSDDEQSEQNQLHEGKYFLATILGVDNGSYMKRFRGEVDFDSWLGSSTIYDPDNDDDVLFYNS